jgi:hypothetical protein
VIEAISGARHSRERLRAVTQPTAGTLYLFDRSRCRYFRKDGHNWRKKKDGKTVRETHEKLKVRTPDPTSPTKLHMRADDARLRTR